MLGLLLLLAGATALVVPARAPVGALRGAALSMRLDGVPAEVLEAERKATPGRRPRLAGTVALGVLSAASAGLCVATLTGQPWAAEIAENVLPFGNAPVSLAVNVVLSGTCVWVYQQELETREQNIQRIWEEVQRRKAQGGVSGKAKKRNKTPAQLRQPQGFVPARSPPPPPSPPPPAPPPAVAPGFFERLGSSQFMEEANAMARVQAMSLNDALEEKGVLSPVERAGRGEGEGTEGAASTEPEGGAAPQGAAPKKKKSKKKKR